MLFCKFKKYLLFGICNYYHCNHCLGKTCKIAIQKKKDNNRLIHYSQKH